MEKLERDYMRELLNMSSNNNDEPQSMELIYHRIRALKTEFPKSKSKYHN